MRIGFYLGKVQRATHGGGHTFEVNFIDSLLKYETITKEQIDYLVEHKHMPEEKQDEENQEKETDKNDTKKDSK